MTDRMSAENIIKQCEAALLESFAEIDELAQFNQDKVLDAFIEKRISQRHFMPTTGYGYGDDGRDTLSQLFAQIFKAQSGLVSPHLLSGTHAIGVCLFAVLRPGDVLLSITGRPYDTLTDIINKPGTGSLGDFGVTFEEVGLKGSDFDFVEIEKKIKALKPKMIFIQRSRGYSDRSSLSVAQIGEAAEFVKRYAPDCVVFVDNCYGEFTEKEEPSIYADLCAGSLIKNPGGGIAPGGGYIVGKKDLVVLCENRLTTPSTGGEIGANPAGYLPYYQGVFLAPHVTAQSMKGVLLISQAMNLLGFEVVPQGLNRNKEVICAVKFGTKETLINFCRGIQAASPVDSHVTPYPWDMPGYADQVIMAAGCFVQGSSIELSCDAPIRPPYIAYIQGGLTYEHVKSALKRCIAGLRA